MHPFFAPWEYQQTIWLFDIFRGYRKGALGKNGLRKEDVAGNGYIFVTMYFDGFQWFTKC